MQIGFDFQDEGQREGVGIEQPAGTWLEPRLTAAQYREGLAAAREGLTGLVGVFRVLFERALGAADVYLAEQGGRSGERPFGWHCNSIGITDDELQRFGPHCVAPSCMEGIETRYRDEKTMELWAMHVAGVGTLTVRRWASGASASFTLGRDAVMRESYRDSRPSYALAVEQWQPSYCADKLAEAGQGVASVPTFSYGGQEWVNDGGWHGPGDRGMCEGWRLVRLEDWHGMTYSYRTQVQAWEDGRLERGDRRGLVVSVRGQRCVLASAARFIA